MCQSKYIEFLASMSLKSIPTETYFVLDTFEPNIAYYRDIDGDIMEINETGMRLAFIPNVNENSVAYIVTEETALTVKFLMCNYKHEPDDYYDDSISFNDHCRDDIETYYDALY